MYRQWSQCRSRAYRTSAILLLLMTAAALPCLADAKADALLKEMRDTARATKSLSADLLYTQDIGTRVLEMRGTLRLKKPNLASIRVQFEDKPVFYIVSDGKTVHTDLVGKPPQSEAADPTGKGLFDGGIVSISLFFNPDAPGFVHPAGFDLQYLGTRTVQGTSYDVIDIINTALKSHTRLFLNAARQLTRIEQFSREDGKRLSMTAALSNIHLNATIADEAFVYTPVKAQDGEHSNSQKGGSTPVLPSIVAQFYKQLNTADTLSFTARYYGLMNLVKDIVPQYLCAVQIKRPNLFVVHSHLVQTAQPAMKSQQRKYSFGDLLLDVTCDGKTQIESNPQTKEYKLSSAPETVERTSSLSLHEVVSGFSAISNKDELNRFQAGPEEKIDGKAVTVFANTVVAYGDKIQAKLYFDKATGELVRFAQFETDETSTTGKMKEHVRVDYSGWKFNIPVPDTIFDTTPPTGGKRVSGVP